LDGVWVEWWGSLKRKAFQHGFSFPSFNFPWFQEWSAVFTRIRESMSTFFCFCLQTPFVLLLPTPYSGEVGEIVPTPVAAVVSAAKIHCFV
jgi:hypothetical protein